MKKTFKFYSLAMACLMATTLAFTACGDDNTEEEPQGSTDIKITAVSPLVDLTPGAVITITGENLDLVTAAGFGTDPTSYLIVAAADFSKQTNQEIKVALPADITFPCGLALLKDATPTIYSGILQGTTEAEVPTGTQEAVGTLTKDVTAVFGPYVYPGGEVAFEIKTDLTNLTNDDVKVTIGDNLVEIPSWITDYSSGKRGINASIPADVQMFMKYLLTVYVNGVSVGTAVVQIDMPIFTFASADYDWNQGFGAGTYSNFNDYRSVAVEKGDYYMHIEVPEMMTSSSAWGVLVNETTTSGKELPNSFITHDPKLEYGIKFRTKIDASTGADVILNFYFKLDNDNDKDWQYPWLIGEETTKGTWFEKFIPFSAFTYWNGSENEVLTNFHSDFSQVRFTKWGIVNGVASWDAKGGAGEGQPLKFDFDNMIFCSQTPSAK
jgi:hypothetical protein